MATEYVVALRNMVSGPAQDALRDVDKLRAALGSLEGAGAIVGPRSGGSGGGPRGPRDTSDSAARNAAFRRLHRAQQEEEQFTRYKIGLMRKEVAEREAAEAAQLRATQRRIRAAQRAEARAVRERSARNGRIGSGMGSALQGGLQFAGGAAVAGVGIALGGAAAAGKQGLDTAKQIEAARMRFTASLGGVEAANAEIKDAFRIAEKTVFDPRQVLDALAQLSTNFKNTDVRRYVLAAVSDFATVSGKGEEGLKSAITAISQIVAKGKLQQEELTGQLGELGLPAKAVYQELATQLGVKDKDEQTRTDKIIKLITAGKVGSDAAVQAITAAMTKQSGSGKAGEYAVKSANTVEGQLSAIQGGFSTLFAMSDAESWPALTELKGLLSDVASFFGVDSAAGQAFMTSIRDALTRYALPAIRDLRKGFADLVGDPKRIDDFVQGIVAIGRRLFSVASAVGWVVEKFVSFYGWLVGMDEAMGFADGWAGRLYARFITVGQAIGQGIVAGIKSVGSFVYEGISNLASGAVNTVKAKLGIQSPSRVMAQLGAYTAQGFGMGIEGGASQVLSASRMLGDAALSGIGGRTMTPGAAGAVAGASGSPINITINLPVTSAGSAAELARGAGPLVGEMIERQLNTYFGRLAAQGV